VEGKFSPLRIQRERILPTKDLVYDNSPHQGSIVGDLSAKMLIAYRKTQKKHLGRSALRNETKLKSEETHFVTGTIINSKIKIGSVALNIL
jgi:hypothetical protein